MAGLDKRDAHTTQARNDLMREMAERGISHMDETERGERVSAIVRRLQDDYPELDEQASKRLIGEAMRREPAADDGPPETEVDARPDERMEG